MLYALGSVATMDLYRRVIDGKRSEKDDASSAPSSSSTACSSSRHYRPLLRIEQMPTSMQVYMCV